MEAVPIPFTAYAFCYIPLAVTIITLITYFVLTDRHASRPYVRYNPFVVATATPEELEQRAPVVGETPAGPIQSGSAETTIYTGGRTGDVQPASRRDLPPPDAPDIQPPLEGTDRGIGHSPLDDEPPRKGIDDSPV
jgi:hypothetical protein